MKGECMKQGTRTERLTLIGQALDIFRKGVAPAIWSARRHDIYGYLAVQNQRPGDPPWLSERDLSPVRMPRVGHEKPNRRFIEDPRNALKVLKASTPIRVEVLDGRTTWLSYIEALLGIREEWARFDPISRQSLEVALTSAEELLEGARAFLEADEIRRLRRCSSAAAGANGSSAETPRSNKAPLHEFAHGSMLEHKLAREQRSAVWTAERLIGRLR